MPAFTEGQHKLLELFSDGKRHSKEEVKRTIQDEHVSDEAMWAAIHRLKNKLEPIGETIVCETAGYVRMYRHVRLLSRTE